MKRLRFLSGVQRNVALLPHCAEEASVLRLIHEVQRCKRSKEVRLFVFDGKCAPTSIKVEPGLAIRWKFETDTFFLTSVEIPEHRLLADGINESGLADLLSDWRRYGSGTTGIVCHDEGGNVHIADLRVIDSPSFVAGTASVVATEL